MGTVGFIGLGSQGGPMALRIVAAGFPLKVWARRAESMAPFTAAGAEACVTIAQLGKACDHVGICVVDDAGVVAVCDELIPAMRPGSRIAIHSTILPDTCVALARQAAMRDIELLDAPVSGGGAGAEKGELTVMCGGRREALDAAMPVFETFGAKIVLLGEIGAGQRAKIVNNALMAANMGLAHAATDAACSLGLDRAAFLDLVASSSGRSFGFDVYRRLPRPGAFVHGAPLLAKDLALLRTILAEERSVEIIATAASNFLTEAMDANA